MVEVEGVVPKSGFAQVLKYVRTALGEEQRMDWNGGWRCGVREVRTTRMMGEEGLCKKRCHTPDFYGCNLGDGRHR